MHSPLVEPCSDFRAFMAGCSPRIASARTNDHGATVGGILGREIDRESWDVAGVLADGAGNLVAPKIDDGWGWVGMPRKKVQINGIAFMENSVKNGCAGIFSLRVAAVS